MILVHLVAVGEHFGDPNLTNSFERSKYRVLGKIKL